MAKHTITCATCQKQFQTDHRRKYCSYECRPSAKISMKSMQDAACRQTHTCIVCSSEFKPKRAGRGTCCGRKCGLEWIAFKATAKASGHRVFVAVKMGGRAQKKEVQGPPAPTGLCNHCGKNYIRSKLWQRYCCDQCSIEAKVQTKQSESYKAARRASRLKRRALERGANGGQRIDPIKVFERDAWRCGICGCKTHKSKRGSYHPRAPELDHIVALANGGGHTWDNVQCSCRSCNGKKGATNYGQIPLFAT